jgi:ParB family chromosome partitioning protein
MRKTLGRGLEALIPEIGNVLKEQERGVTEGTRKIPVNKIKPNRYQAREKFDEGAIAELANSILEHGLVQPVIVLPCGEDGTYELVAGERRWRATKKAGLTEIPAIIKPLNERQSFILSLIENLQRKDLNAIEEAVAYKRLMMEFNLKQEELAKVLGKTRTTIANTVRLLSLPDKIQEAVIEGVISEGHARALASIDDPGKQGVVLDNIINKQLTVREVERLSRRIKNVKSTKDPEITATEEELQRALGTKVEISHRGKSGKIIISYFSLEDLNRIICCIDKKQ